MQYIGKIDRDIFKCVTTDITTDEVIITDERLEHIRQRHPNDYQQSIERIKKSVEQPDYIIHTDAPDTAFILKQFQSEGACTRTILRLHTSKDDPSRKNSVITYQQVNEHEYNRLVRNKRILYKRF